jgi:hypothetical protein
MDKYRGKRSVFPAGYADPEREPLYPQERAEIMALGRALSAEEEAEILDLGDCVVGPQTAREMNWKPAGRRTGYSRVAETGAESSLTLPAAS